MIQSQIAEETLHWIRSFIMAYNICPFAKGPVNKGTLRISVSELKKKSQALEELIAEMQWLDQNPSMETTLLVYADGFKDFFAYLDFVDLAEQLTREQGYEGIYQIATFHPDYYFADATPDDVTNYSNRSPYPMIHILREEHLEKAIAAYGDTELIPEKNRSTLQELGLDKIKQIIARCN